MNEYHDDDVVVNTVQILINSSIHIPFTKEEKNSKNDLSVGIFLSYLLIHIKSCRVPMNLIFLIKKDG